MIMSVHYRLILHVILLLSLAACGPAYRSSVLHTPENQHLKGHQKPYIVNGEVYRPLADHKGFVETGIASWYGKDFHGRKTSNGETYDMYAMTAAHKTLPLGVFVKVRNIANDKETIVRVNDRGPFVKGRIIDLSYSAAKELDVVGPGTAQVRIEALGYRSTDSDSGDSYILPKSYYEGHFGIQVGAFTVEENARRLRDDLKRRVGAASIQQEIVNGTLFYRVRGGDYKSIDEALSALPDYESQGFGNSFIVALD